MYDHLWLEKGEAPEEYLTLILCRDVYHCRPSELKGEDWHTIQGHLQVLAAEAQVRRMQRKAAKNKKTT